MKWRFCTFFRKTEWNSKTFCIFASENYQLLTIYHKNIIDKWVKFFVLKQSVRSTNIKKKL